ncbi:MAG: hypothetical protein ABJG88_04710 [Litorimonas sp.]
MTQSLQKISLSQRNFLPAILVFTLPWLADILIFAGTQSAAQMLSAPKILLMNGLYAAAPFFFTALAMRPRLRVSQALWVGAALTCVLWMLFAITGRGVGLDVGQKNGTTFLWLFIILMIWPCVVTILMGVTAKFRERPLEAELDTTS